jgi:hypothetical protein
MGGCACASCPPPPIHAQIRVLYALTLTLLLQIASKLNRSQKAAQSQLKRFSEPPAPASEPPAPTSEPMQRPRASQVTAVPTAAKPLTQRQVQAKAKATEEEKKKQRAADNRRCAPHAPFC